MLPQFFQKNKYEKFAFFNLARVSELFYIFVIRYAVGRGQLWYISIMEYSVYENVFIHYLVLVLKYKKYSTPSFILLFNLEDTKPNFNLHHDVKNTK